MGTENEGLRELFAEARAIYLSMLHGAITRPQAKLLTKPILRRMNATGKLIAKEHKIAHREIKFPDLGINI